VAGGLAHVVDTQGGREGGREGGRAYLDKDVVAGGFAHVINTQGGDRGARHCFHFHAGLALDTDGAVDQDLVRSVQVVIEPDVNVAVLQRQRMAKRNKLARLLGAHHPGDNGSAEHGALGAHQFLAALEVQDAAHGLTG